MERTEVRVEPQSPHGLAIYAEVSKYPSVRSNLAHPANVASYASRLAVVFFSPETIIRYGIVAQTMR